MAWGVLADGLLTGKFNAFTRFGADDHRNRMPEFQGEFFLRRLKQVEALRPFAMEKDVTLGQLALRWAMDKSKWVCPLFGAKTPRQVNDNLGAAGWRLSSNDMETIEKLLSTDYADYTDYKK